MASNANSRVTIPRRNIQHPLTSSETLGDLDTNSDGIRELADLQDRLPFVRATVGFFRYDNHVAGAHLGTQRSTTPHSRAASDYGTISTQDKDCLLVRHLCGTTGLLQIPFRALARLKGNGRGVINGPI